MPSFTVDTTAGGTTLTAREVSFILSQAASGQQEQIRTATTQLQKWEKSSGYFEVLQTIYLDHSLPIEIRSLAILQLKNGIDKYWRRGAANAISKDEKTRIRERSVESCLSEPIDRLALQAAVVNAKIVRYDFPQIWPDAISSIANVIATSSQSTMPTIRVSRALLLLLFVAKELSTAKLPAPRKAFRTTLPTVLAAIFPLYLQDVEKWQHFLRHGGDNESDAMASLAESLLALRVIRRVVPCFEFPNRQEEVQEVWTRISRQFGEILTFLSSGESSRLGAGPRNVIERLLLQTSKLHLAIAREHPAAFALLPGSVDLARSYWLLAADFSKSYGLEAEPAGASIGHDGDLDDEVPFMEKLALKSLLLLRSCAKIAFHPITTISYQQKVDKEEKKEASERLRKEIFDQISAQDMTVTLMTKYFVFTRRDLRQWEEEPDEWEKSQEDAGDDWDFSIRTCAEKLFLDLIINMKKELMDTLIQQLQIGFKMEQKNVLHKDSVYAATGLAAPVLDGTIHIDVYITQFLIPDIQSRAPGSNILRRRIAIMLGQWMPIQVLDQTQIYGIFQHLLDKSEPLNDQVVRVTAGRQLLHIIDPYNFDYAVFAPFAPSLLGALVVLVQEVALTETKLALLHTLSRVVITLESNVEPFAGEIIAALQGIWSAAGDDYMLKQSILGILHALVTALKSESGKYHQILVSLVRSSIDPSSNSQQYLLEDALDLWEALVEQSPSPPSSEIASLINGLLPMLESGSESLKKALDIMEGYVYLMPAEVLSSSSHILSPFTNLLSNPRKEIAGIITCIIELLIRAAYPLGGLPAVEKLAGELISSSFITPLLIALKDCFEANQTTGPNAIRPPIESLVETGYFSVIARLAIYDPNVLIRTFQATLRTSSMDWLVKEWFAHFDSISSSEKKKLSGMALTALLDAEGIWILNHLQSYLSMWTDLVTDLVYEREDDKTRELKKVDCLVCLGLDGLALESDSPNAIRELRLKNADPVHRIDIRAYIHEKLGNAIARNGGPQTFQEQWMKTLDQDVVRAFGELGII